MPVRNSTMTGKKSKTRLNSMTVIYFTPVGFTILYDRKDVAASATVCGLRSE